MSKNNYINISTSEKDDFIYRIISIERLFELFSNKKNVLVKPHKWDDPFENFIFRSKLVYGQCWTLHKASDAMWRIYSPKLNAVRIRSRISVLLESLYKVRSKHALEEVFIGKVEYLRNERLMSFAQSVSQDANTPTKESLAKTLLVKRPAFRHEREVRLLFLPHNKSDGSQDMFSYFIDPNSLIDQIMIDPRLPQKDVSLLKAQIRDKTSFSGEIKRSLLYAPPPKFYINT